MLCYKEKFLSGIEPLELVMAKFYRSQVYMISAVICCRFVEFDTSVICHVFMHCFGSFLLQAMFFKSPSICFRGISLFQKFRKLLL